MGVRKRRLGALAAAATALTSFVLTAPGGPVSADPYAPASCEVPSVHMVNGDFEVPTQSGMSWGLVPAADMAPWQTTDPAQVFEVWWGGFGMEPAHGNQLVEINSNDVVTIYQEIATTPGTTLNWSFEHRARLPDGGGAGSAQDTVRLVLGPTLADGVAQGEFTSTDAAWERYAGEYVVPAGQSTTVIAFESLSTAGGPGSGNMLDNVNLSVQTPPCLTAHSEIVDEDGGDAERGDLLTVRHTITNVGEATAADVRALSAIPAQTTYVPGSLSIDGAAVTDVPGDDPADVAAAVAAWRLGSGADATTGGEVVHDAAVTVSFRVQIDPGASGPITATATATGAWPGHGALEPATSDEARVVVTPPATDIDLVSAIALDPAAAPSGTVLAGSPLGFDVTTANEGQATASPVTVVVTASAELGALSAQADPAYPGATCAVAGQVATCTYPALAKHEAALTRVYGVVAPSLPVGSAGAVTVVASAPQPDTEPGNNEASAPFGPTGAAADLIANLTVGGASPVAVLTTPQAGFAPMAAADTAGGGAVDTAAVTTTAPPAALLAGSAVTYQAVVTNVGPSTAAGTSAVLRLDPALREWTVTATDGVSCVALGTTVVCSIPAIGPGEDVVVAVNGRLSPAANVGSYTAQSRLQVSSPTPDPDAANNVATLLVPLDVSAAADLGTNATVTTPQIVAGQPISYAVTTTNVGPSDARDVVVRIEVPAGVLNPVATPAAGGTCALDGAVILCRYPVMRAGTTIVTTVTGGVDPAAGPATSFALIASSSSSTPDPNAANDVPTSAVTPAGAVRAISVSASSVTGSAPVALAKTGVEARESLTVALIALFLGAGMVRLGRASR